MLFDLKRPKFHFESDELEWMTVSGDLITVQRTGVADGVSGYAFRVTAIDGSPDTFRIRIWDESSETVLYDNEVDAPELDPTTTPVTGSVVVYP